MIENLKKRRIHSETRARLAAGVALTLATLWATPGLATPGDAATVGVKSALDDERLGLFSGREFGLTTGRCVGCTTPKAALWYFQDEVIAVPRNGSPSEVPLVWVGAVHILEHGRLSADGRSVQAEDGAVYRFSLVPQLPTNRSYYDESSARFFRQRPLRVRGTVVKRPDDAPTLLARTVWPEDYRIDPDALPLDLLGKEETLASLIEAERGGAQSHLSVRVLWKRRPAQARVLAEKAVLGFILNGAQGDDDEAHGGHFAIVTGRFGPNGEWADWMVNNFYDLDYESEKGIVAAMTPMDNYLMDLNSGQAYYRPTYLLVAVLREDRAARWVQEAMVPVFRSFYAHRLIYDHAGMNCVGISLDTLRGIGWRIPTRGPTSYAMAVGGFAYGVVTDRSWTSGRKLFDYLAEERTRLLPRIGYEAGGEDLLALLDGRVRRVAGLSEFEQMLRDDVEAVLFFRIPQIPSSRAFGRDPVASLEEYRRRVPADRSRWNVVPVRPRPLPPRDSGPRCGRKPETRSCGGHHHGKLGNPWHCESLRRLPAAIQHQTVRTRPSWVQDDWSLAFMNSPPDRRDYGCFGGSLVSRSRLIWASSFLSHL